MQLTVESQLNISADPLQLYELLLTPSTLQPISRHSIGKTFFVNRHQDPDDRTFMWKYQFAGATLTTVGTPDVMQPGHELGVHLSGDVIGYLRWLLFPVDDQVRVVLSIDFQLRGGVFGKLTSSFVRNQVEFELASVLSNLRTLAQTDPAVARPISH